MAMNLQFWIMLIITFVDSNAEIKDLHDIEDNFIAAFKPNMNRKGNYRCRALARCLQLSRIEKMGKHNIDPPGGIRRS